MSEELLTYDELDNQIDLLFNGKERFVQYACYDTPDDLSDDDLEKKIITSHLDDVAAYGYCIFVRENDTFFGGSNGKDYQSLSAYNPTWKQLCILANDAIVQTNDYHHVYLEGIRFVGVYDDHTNVFEFQMGS